MTINIVHWIISVSASYKHWTAPVVDLLLLWVYCKEIRWVKVLVIFFQALCFTISLSLAFTFTTSDWHFKSWIFDHKTLSPINYIIILTFLFSLTYCDDKCNRCLDYTQIQHFLKYMKHYLGRMTFRKVVWVDDYFKWRTSTPEFNVLFVAI